MHLRWLCLICLLAFYVQSAESKPYLELAIKSLSQEDSRIYKESLESCLIYRERRIANFDLTDQEKRTLIGTFGDTNYVAMSYFSDDNSKLIFKNTDGLGTYLHTLLNSQGFIFAMKKCFHDDETSENIYVGKLLLIDAAAKGLVLGVTLIPLPRLLSFLAAHAWGKVIIGLMLTQSVTGSSEQIRKKSLLEIMEQNLDLLKKDIQSMKILRP